MTEPSYLRYVRHPRVCGDLTTIEHYSHALRFPIKLGMTEPRYFRYVRHPRVCGDLKAENKSTTPQLFYSLEP